MQADLICIGNELLTGLVENTNAGLLARRLQGAGINVREAAIVPDSRSQIRDALERALAASEVVITTGGLGPTDDDLTREAVAETLGRRLILDRAMQKRLEDFFQGRGLNMTANNRKQAFLIEGAEFLENNRGTAPGMMLETGGKVIVLLPGPPGELRPIFDRIVLPRLRELTRGQVTVIKTLKCAGLGESRLEDRIKAIEPWDLPPVAYVSSAYEVRLQVKGVGEPAVAAAMVEEAERRLREALGDCLYGGEDDSLAGVAAEFFRREQLTLAAAESCSGGLLSDMITDIPGSSNFYKGAIVAYTDEAKSALLGIDRLLLAQEGAVSEAVALALARAAARTFGADCGVAITGLAGPDTDKSGLPAGLVYVAATAGEKESCLQLNLGGGRRAIKERAARAALDMLRKVAGNRRKKGSV